MFVLLQFPTAVSRVDVVSATVLAFAALGLVSVFLLGVIAFFGTTLFVPIVSFAFMETVVGSILGFATLLAGLNS